MEFFACLIGFRYGRLLFPVGLYDEGQTFFLDLAASSSGMTSHPSVRMWNIEKLRWGSLQANLYSRQPSLNDGTQTVLLLDDPLYFPSMLTWGSPERGSLETGALRVQAHSHLCTVNKTWNQDRDSDLLLPDLASLHFTFLLLFIFLILLLSLLLDKDI